MPDRKLTEEEHRKLKERLSSLALQVLFEEDIKPTLHDLCILELYGMIECHKEHIARQGKEINALKERLKKLEGEKQK